MSPLANCLLVPIFHNDINLQNELEYFRCSHQERFVSRLPGRVRLAILS